MNANRSGRTPWIFTWVTRKLVEVSDVSCLRPKLEKVGDVSLLQCVPDAPTLVVSAFGKVGGVLYFQAKEWHLCSFQVFLEFFCLENDCSFCSFAANENSLSDMQSCKVNVQNQSRNMTQRGAKTLTSLLSTRPFYFKATSAHQVYQCIISKSSIFGQTGRNLECWTRSKQQLPFTTDSLALLIYCLKQN